MKTAARPVLLSLALFAAALLAMLPATRQVVGRAHYGSFVFAGLPTLAALLGLAFAPLAGRRVAAPGSFFRFAPWFATGFLIDQSFLGLAHMLGWVSFTYGDQGLSGHPFRATLWGLPLCIVLGTFGVERALRAGILADAAGGRLAGRIALSVGTGLVLAAPPILCGSAFIDPDFVASSLAVALTREIALVLIYLCGGGLGLCGALRGAWMFFEGFVITDVNSLWLPLAQYTTSEPRFYLLRAATAAAATAVVAAGALRQRARP